MNDKTLIIKLLILMCGYSLSIGSASASFVNGGFETGDFTGWVVGGLNGGSAVGTDGTAIAATDFPAYINTHSGNYAASTAVAHTYREYLSLTQSVYFLTGNSDIRFFMGNDSQNIFGIDAAIRYGNLGIYLDGIVQSFEQTSLSANFPVGSDPSDMLLFNSLINTTPGVHTIEFRFSGSGTSRSGISIDDISATNISPIPIPAAIWLTGSGLLALISFSRKMNSQFVEA